MPSLDPPVTVPTRASSAACSDASSTGTESSPTPRPPPKLTRTLTSFLWVAVPKVAAGGAQLLTNLLLVRTLGPEHAGVVFVCVTTITLSDAVLGSAFDVAVLKLATSAAGAGSAHSLRIQKAALVAKVLGCAALALPVLIFGRPLSILLFHNAADIRLLALSVISLFGLLILRSVQTCFQVAGRFPWYGAADLFHCLVKYGGVGALLGLGMTTPLSVLLIYACGPLAVAAVLLFAATKQIVLARFSWQILRQLCSAAKWYVGSAAAASTNTRMDILLLSAVAGTLQAGLFSAAQVLILPVQMVGMYLGVVFAPQILPLWEQNRLSSPYHRFQAGIIAASLAIWVLAILFAERTSALLLPSSYRASTGIVLILLPAALTALVNFPWTVSFLMFAHPKFLLLFEIVALPVLAALYWHFGAVNGARGVAFVTSAFAILKTVVYQVLASRTMRLGPKRAPSTVKWQTCP